MIGAAGLAFLLPILSAGPDVGLGAGIIVLMALALAAPAFIAGVLIGLVVLWQRGPRRDDPAAVGMLVLFSAMSALFLVVGTLGIAKYVHYVQVYDLATEAPSIAISAAVFVFGLSVLAFSAISVVHSRRTRSAAPSGR